MTTPITQNPVSIVLAGGFLIGLWCSESLGSQECKNNAGDTKRVCVQWERQAAPVEGSDFTVDYSCQGCTDDPAVALAVGDQHWAVWSEVISTGAPANIGSLSTTDSENYVVTLANGTNPGAANVGSMVLAPDGAAYSSSIGAGSKISGDLTGNLSVKESSGGSGGTALLTIDGDVEGDITVPTVSSLSIGGNVTSTSGINIQNITGAMSIGGNLNGDLNVSEQIAGDGSLTIDGNVSAWLEVTNGVAGSISGGTVTSTGYVVLGQDGTFTGNAEFDSVESSGYVMTLLADASGTIHITGNVAGTVAVAGSAQAGGGNLLDGGVIQIDGNVSHYVRIQRDLAGEIRVGGDVTSAGDILVDEDLTSTGDIEVTGDIDGDVDIDGEMSGNICADNLDPEEGLPANITIASFGPGWTICDVPGCICDGPSCGTAHDCNDNDVWDACDISEGTSQDCDCDGIPDDGGDCDPTNQDAQIAASAPAHEDSLWRTENNVARVTFCCDVDAPDSEDVLIREMLGDEQYGDNLSASFTFTMENDRVLKIHGESAATLDHRTWYAIQNNGAWSGVESFTVQYVVQEGDANNDGAVLNTDAGLVNAAIPTAGADDDDRRDINGDGYILNTDAGLVNVRIPSAPVSKPSGH